MELSVVSPSIVNVFLTWKSSLQEGILVKGPLPCVVLRSADVKRWLLLVAPRVHDINLLKGGRKTVPTESSSEWFNPTPE